LNPSVKVLYNQATMTFLSKMSEGIPVENVVSLFGETFSVASW